MDRTVATPTSSDRILESFARLVAERGYGQTSLADVAEQVDISKSTILYHFGAGAKERLLYEVEMGYMVRRQLEVDAIEEWYPEPVDQIVAMIYALLRVHRDERTVSRVLMREFSLLADAEIMRPVRAIRERYMARVSRMLREAARAGTLEVDDLSLTTLHLFGMCNHAWTWYRPDGTHSLVDIAHTFVHTFIRGLATDPETATAATRRLPEIAGRLDELTPAVLAQRAGAGD